MPVLARYRMASTNSRVSFPTPPCPPACPGNRWAIRFQCSSLISCRLSMAASEREIVPPGYRIPPKFSQHGLILLLLFLSSLACSLHPQKQTNPALRDQGTNLAGWSSRPSREVL